MLRTDNVGNVGHVIDGVAFLDGEHEPVRMPSYSDHSRRVRFEEEA